MRFQGKVVYVPETAGGERETVAFEAGNVTLAAWERYAMRNKLPMGKDSPPTLSSLVMAHHALRIEAGFDAWIAEVEEIELVPIEAREDVTAASLRAFLGLAGDASEKDVQGAVRAALANSGDDADPPTLPAPGTV